MRSRYPKFIIHDSGTGERVLLRDGAGPRYQGISNWGQREMVEWANAGTEMRAEKDAEVEKQKRRVARARKKVVPS